MLKKSLFSLLALFYAFNGFSQLKDVKIIIPKEVSYTYYDLIQFLPGEKFFVVAANSLAVYNTETSEVIDEYDLSYGVKCLSISRDGKYIAVAIGSELMVFTFENQKLQLFFKSTTAELLKGQPGAEYYGAMPIGGCFFTGKPEEMYINIASFSLLFDLSKKAATSSHAFPSTDYVIHALPYYTNGEAILAKSSGTVYA
ncbi:MAG: hypothetical protein K0S12_507, partial [Bacteroidetes bacterium]|nr:hypothetical protein [Bacteroidota bacterium]